MCRNLPKTALKRPSRKLKHPIDRLLLFLPLFFLLPVANAQINISFNVTQPSCFGLPTGSVTAMASGGTGSYTYLWNTGQTGPTLSAIPAGNYSVTVSDSGGANASGSITVSQPTLVTVNLTANVCQVPFVITANGNGGLPPYTYSWSTGASGATITVATSGTYCVTMTDQNLCGAVDCIDVTYNPLNVSVVTNNLTCTGSNDGQVTAIPTGGNPPYTYQWSNGATTASQSNLAPGTYTVTVTDAAGCTDSASGTVLSPPPLIVDATGAGPNCPGGNNGSASVLASGGTPPYTYLWSTGAMTTTISNLTTGSYSVTVTDANGCVAMDIVILNPISNLMAVAGAMPESCPDTNDGTATASPVGGVPPYTYIWSNGGNTATISGLVPGTYSVTIIDGAGCMATASTSVAEAPAFNINVSATNVTTCNAANGTATANILQGIGPFTYSWSNGGNTQTITGLTGGTYSVTVTDANGCTDTGTAIINEPPDVFVMVIATDTICPGTSDGQAAAIVSGGTGPFSYLWNTGATTSSIDNLPAGAYSVTVTDAFGCQASGSATIVEAPPFLVSIIGTETVCSPETSGQATAMPDGGAAPYSYLWSTGATTQTIIDIPEGTFSVTVTDANGCVAIAEFDVDIIDDFDVTGMITPVLCFGGATGTISTTTVGGTAPYSYSWSNGATTANISNLNAGVYMLTVTEANGCQVMRAFIVSQPTELVATASGTNPDCAGAPTGSAMVSTTGGTPPYTYLWSNGGTTATINNLMGGAYSVTVTDAHLCTDVASVTLSSPASLQVTLSTQNVLCNGEATGSASATVSGGTPPYTYAWSNGSSGSSVGNLAAGNYTLTVTDAHNCTTTTSFTISQSPELIVALTISNIFCDPAGTGSITANTVGGTPPYSFEWSNGASGMTISGLSAGAYTVTVTDVNECEAIATGTVQEFPGLMLTPIATSPNCFGEMNGAAAVIVSGGTMPFTFLWNTGSTDAQLLNIPAGAYSVTVMDAAGCSGTVVVGVTQPLELIAQINSTNVTNVSCNGFANGQATITVSGGTPPYSYSWSNGATTATASNLSAGSYTVTVTDANGCEDTAMVTITQPPALMVSASASTSGTCSNTTDGAASVSASGGTPPYSYLWSTGATGANLSNLAAGAYTVTVTDAKGCTGSASITIQSFPAPSCSINVTNEVSPAGNDGAAQVVVSSGTPPFAIAWSNGQSGANATNLTPGAYSATVTDDNGCQSSCTVTLAPPARLGDYVWLDTDRDGIQDANENGIPGVMVILQIPGDSDPTNIDTTFTNGDGYYYFDVIPGDYKVLFINPGGLVFTDSNQGPNDALDSDVDPTMGMTGVYTIGPGETNLTIDAGLYNECENITNPGLIGPSQFLCGPGNDPDPILNVQFPSGGSGPIEYLWMVSTQPGPFNVQTWSPIPGATGPSYDPPVLYETTYYARCVRREGCDIYLESNIVTIEVGSVAVADIQGPDYICVGETETFFAAQAGPNAVINWAFSGPVSPLSATGSPVQITANNFGLIHITLTVTENGCTSTDVETLTATNSPIYCAQLLPITVEVTNQDPGEVLISWMAEQGLPGLMFKVEHSKDGTNFQTLGQTNTPRAFLGSMSYFEFEDFEAKLGRNYYRIRVEAPDGEVFYSEIGEAIIYGDSKIAMIYPNPVSQVATLEIFETFDTDVNAEIFNVNGARMWSKNLPKDVKRIEIDLSQYPSGTYFLKLRYGKTGEKVLKVLKH
ncbi:MAG: T9SS type A sorting domain-containing protein [Lewinellaceae bacterium]|nr:T9SS type A sorting domain-containing protein [Lewinellaceae bacterium]